MQINEQITHDGGWPFGPRNELTHRIRVERPRLIQRIQEAIADDTNLAENSEYQAAKTEQERNEARIGELEDKLARAEIINVAKLSGDTIKSARSCEPATTIRTPSQIDSSVSMGGRNIGRVARRDIPAERCFHHRTACHCCACCISGAFDASHRQG
jgi:hypothetical protein